ncbi:MAG: MFS transporter [Candidatus Thermoplasmatota archaeon]|jgi:predicted phosphate transport protein (TIGR00153 family)|nr:MFS transporter [Candidatus Thermoplasmatota archaeon]
MSDSNDNSYNERKRLLEAMDETKLSKFHLKTWLVSGMGFFTDAYDLFIIGMVIAILATPWHLTKFQEGLLGSTSLIAAVFGALIFGKLLDVYGRKAIYGIELIILIAGALLSALSTNIDQLILWRFVLGIGIGGDYAASAIIMSEYANRKDRGKLVGMVFSMQSLGLLVGPLITMILLQLPIPVMLDWRILLAIGTIPPLLVVYYRRQISESPRFLLAVKGDVSSAKKSINQVVTVENEQNIKNNNVKINSSGWILFTNKKLLLLTIGVSLSWFLMDWAFYGNTISTSFIMGSIASKASLYTIALYTFVIFAVFAFPGYWLATSLLDTLGRKSIQAMGFAVMSVCYITISIVPAIMHNITYFIGIYGISYFFIEFGPNVTTFVYPSEIFPSHVRGTGDGIAASSGKIGAFIGTLLFPILNIFVHITGVFAILAFLSLIGVVVTILILPETKQKSLEEASGEDELTVVLTQFSSQLLSLITNAEDASEKFVKLCKEPDQNTKAKYVKQIKVIEHNSDTIVHQIHVNINRGKVSQLTRMDVIAIASSVDDIIDEVEAVSARFDIFNYPVPDKRIIELSNIIKESIKEIHYGITVLDRLLKKDYKDLEKVCISVNTLENRADDILREGIKELFNNEKNVYRLLVYKEIYEKLEEVTDRCEDVTDVFKDLIVKYIQE